MMNSLGISRESRSGIKTTENALIRCDFFEGSGVGHLTRCHALGKALVKVGITPTIVLDDGTDPLPIRMELQQVRFTVHDFNEIEDAKKLTRLASDKGARLVIGDSYRITKKWINVIKKSGLLVALIDDLHIGADADLRIDYTPGATELSGTSLNLLGPSFFLTNKSRVKSHNKTCKRVIAHAGGTSNYSSAIEVYRVLTDFVAKNSLQLDWLVTNKDALETLKRLNLFKPNHGQVQWTKTADSIWSSYDLIVGPASTSLFEAIMQNTLPISFPISESQTSSRKPFLTIGHALQITFEELNDPQEIRQIMKLSYQHYSFFLDAINHFSTKLDGLGADRVAKNIASLLTRSAKNSTSEHRAPHPSKLAVRSCDIRDTLNFLEARNAPKVRSVSSQPDHKIKWSEHLTWWIDGATEKFVVTQDDLPEAFFWHRPMVLGDQRYLIGGWFPSLEGNGSFSTVAVLLDWQLKYCAKKHPNCLWVAIINKANEAVIALNRYHGFSDASRSVRLDAIELFPKTSEEFVVLQRKAYL